MAGFGHSVGNWGSSGPMHDLPPGAARGWAGTPITRSEAVSVTAHPGTGDPAPDLAASSPNALPKRAAGHEIAGGTPGCTLRQQTRPGGNRP